MLHLGIPRRKSAGLRALLAAIGVTSIAVPALAANRYWVGTDGLWQNGPWSDTAGGAGGASAPIGGENVYLLSNTTITVTRDLSSGTPNPNLGTVQLDGSGGAVVTLEKSGSTTSLGVGTLLVGVTGRGAFNLAGGTFSASSASSLGNAAGSSIGTVLIASGAATFNGITVNPGSAMVNQGGSLTLNGATTVSAGTIDLGVSSIILNASRTLIINDGFFAAYNLTTSTSASVNFNSGTLVMRNADLNPAMNQILGAGSISLPATRTLVVGGTTTLSAANPIVINGGTFSTGSLAGNTSALQFNSGTFRLTAANLTVGTGGLLGSTVTLDATRRLEVGLGYSAIIDATGQLCLTGGAVDAAAGITNNGVVQLASPTARMSGASLVNNGLVAGTGRVLASLDNHSAGEVRVGATDQMRFEATSNSNSGLINLIGGVADFTGTLNNTTGGRITGRGTLRTSGLSNSGDVALSAGVSDVYGDVTNQSGAHVTVSGNGNVTFWDDVTNNAGGSIKVSPGSVATFFGAYAGSGITGGGSVYFERDISPGFSPAAITIAGNVAFGNESKLKIELAGTARGSQYDAIDVAGSVSIDGSLAISRLNSFIPLPGMKFDVLSYSERSDQFQIINETGLAGLIITPSYGVNSLQLSMSGIGGDANLDGKVDVRDLLILAQHWQHPANWTGADFNLDGLVDVKDLTLLARNWQTGVGASQDSVSLGTLMTSLGLPAQSIPEPTAITMMTLLGFALGARRRR